MEQKTKIKAEEGKQEMIITREFDLPVELLFKAHVEPDIFEQWMSHEYGTTKVLKLESRKHGSFRFEKSDAQGNILFSANGVIHDFVPNTKITRTFEMENVPFDVQIEYIDFKKLTDETSALTIHTVFRSAELRDMQLKMPFAFGINMAHNRLEEIVNKLK